LGVVWRCECKVPRRVRGAGRRACSSLSSPDGGHEGRKKKKVVLDVGVARRFGKDGRGVVSEIIG